MINKIKGTRDLGPKEAKLIEYIRREFLDKTKAYNFNWIDTPIMEYAELYKRSVQGSEIVKKEMYEFLDKSNRNIALRPEGTAGFVRALVEQKWLNNVKVTKFAYFGPMFRYEQPQKGRYRQFNQAGIEFISELNPYNDAEIVILANEILTTLNINFKLKINSIGTLEERKIYEQALREYLLPFKNQLSSLSQERLSNNVLRILDDKIDSQKEFVQKAPKIFDYLNNVSKKYFQEFITILKNNHINFEIDYSLVRGLDYYDQIVFEFINIAKNSAAQSTLIGGGRYSNLIAQLGGPNVSACGWGFGVDRCADVILEQNNKINLMEDYLDVLIASTTEENLPVLFSLTNELRKYGIRTEVIKKVEKNKKIFDKANKLQAKYLIFKDSFDTENIYVAKDLINNDKIKFAYTVDGYADLLEFLATNIEILENLELDEDEDE
ncbi:histidine--tRNA ligase [Mycoplasma sp. 1018B]|uniref:histidine--tRNA ligase n=1 Tax=Mycoplasma sp. 1018B TaxID=2967302 RepID=UPI00211BF280|nr:histidine--tRNA ligase [Mycoplasma sp. 1018B]UUM19405.1 histidine--tRNA ligase [Mycoplasma sp. 1018B]